MASARLEIVDITAGQGENRRDGGRVSWKTRLGYLGVKQSRELENFNRFFLSGFGVSGVLHSDQAGDFGSHYS